MKKTIAIGLSIFVTLALAVYGMLYLEDYRWNKEHVQPTVAASDSGVYLLHPNHRPKRLLEWSGDEHAFLWQAGGGYALDGDTLYMIDAATETVEKLYTDIDLDWSLGADAFSVFRDRVYYLPPEEPHWGFLPGLGEAEVQIRTVVCLSPDGELHTEIPVTPWTKPIIRCSFGYLCSIAQKRDSGIALVHNGEKGSYLKSEWWDKPVEAVLLNAYNDLCLIERKTDGTLLYRELVTHRGKFSVHASKKPENHPALAGAYTMLQDGEGDVALLYLSADGALCLDEHRSVSVIDDNVPFSETALDTAQYQAGCLTITDGERTWVYVKVNAKWKCWRLS